MATRRTVRNIAPPRRYGYDDASSEDMDADGDDEYIPMVNSASSSDNDDDDLQTATSDDDDDWHFVQLGEDSGPLQVTFSGSPGMRNDIDTSEWSLREYIRHYLPDNLI